MIGTDTQKIAAQFRLSGWGEAVKERIAGGQTVSAFCKAHGISKNTYYYRQKKVREAACVAMVNSPRPENSVIPRGWTQLAEIAPATVPDNTLTIEISDCRIKVDAGTDTTLLAKVCGVLRSL